MKFIIEKNNQGLKIKDFLKKNQVSSALIRKLKKSSDGILVNGSHQNVIYKLVEGDILEINYKDEVEDVNAYLEPVNIPIEIIYEDENITVVNKPANMPTHESLNNRGNTLANALRFRYKELPYVFRATNRLDKDTSGVVLTANNQYYSALLSNKIKNGKICKEYIAIVEGKLTGKGVIEANIDRVGQSIIKREVRSDGEYALTEYESLLSCDDISVILVKPKTGRTHQIRVHMAHIGYPIVGDVLYGEESCFISRQALHCYKMDVEDVGCFVAPISSDMVALIRRYFNEEDFQENI